QFTLNINIVKAVASPVTDVSSDSSLLTGLRETDGNTVLNGVIVLLTQRGPDQVGCRPEIDPSYWMDRARPPHPPMGPRDPGPYRLLLTDC
uniref:Uncharacterized protein n=1 Tax=Cyclopterus lumpus TaxID=8103 RepID=A0A8C3AIU2_CYCLU